MDKFCRSDFIPNQKIKVPIWAVFGNIYSKFKDTETAYLDYCIGSGCVLVTLPACTFWQLWFS